MSTEPAPSLDNFDFAAGLEPDAAPAETNDADVHSEDAPADSVDVETDGGDAEPEIQEQAGSEATTWNLKFGDESRSVSLEEMKELAEKAYGADQRFQEASGKEQQIAEFLTQVKSNPALLLERLGVDPREWAEKRLSDHIEESMLDPAELEKRNKLKELDELKAKQKQQEETQKREQLMAYKHQQQQALEDKVLTAMAEVDLDPEDSTERLITMTEAISRVYNWKKNQMRKGLPSEITENAVKTAINQVAQQRKAVISNMVRRLDAAGIVELLGDEGTKKVREYELGKLKRDIPTGKDTRGQGTTPKKDTGRKKITKYRNEADFDKIIRGED